MPRKPGSSLSADGPVRGSRRAPDAHWFGVQQAFGVRFSRCGSVTARQNGIWLAYKLGAREAATDAC